MDRILTTIRPYMERLARPYANPPKAKQSTADLGQEYCVRIWQKRGISDPVAVQIVGLHLFDGLSLTDVAKRVDMQYDKTRRTYHATMAQLERDLEDVL